MFLVGCANVLDVVKHPMLNKSNPEGANNSRNNLSGEHDTGRNLHIMPELQVESKVTGLVICHVSNCFEDHIGNGPPWKDVPSK